MVERGFRMKMVCEASMAVALGTKLSKPKVIPMYPITPQTHIVEHLAEFINNGEMDAEMIHVESEHSAASALIGSVAAGVRSFTATASQGLALMYEILPIISGMRLPCVMAVANRALSAPINIWNDHSDAVSARDQGWIQLWVESSQEALDTTIQAFKISENEDVMLPVMVNLDGFTLSHVWEPLDVPEQNAVNKFLPEFKLNDVLDVEKPKTFGPIGFPTHFMELKHMQQEAMERAEDIVKKVNSEYKKQFDRSYGDGMLDLYRMDDAEYALIGMGSLCGTARVVVDELRDRGKKVGLIKLKCLRPFPKRDLQKAVKGLKGLAVIDRHISLGYEGALYSDVKSAIGDCLYLSNYITGLGGRDIKLQHIESVFNDLEKGKPGRWLF